MMSNQTGPERARPITQTLRRSFWLSLVTVAILLAAIWFGGRAWMERSVMPYTGEQPLPGLSQDVKILFDDRGIPRVYGESDTDVLQTLGWLHAGERLFQMELIRRLTRGELSELVGAVALEIDELHRSFGFARRVAEEPIDLAPESHAWLQAYVDGINAYMDHTDALPPEFLFLGQKPEPWSVDDVLAIAYYQTWYPTTLVQRISMAWRELVDLHGAAAAEWLSSDFAWQRTTLPGGRMSEGSNTWTLAPERSESGQALHAADPHLEYDQAPGMWYAAGLHSQESLDVIGVTVPGLPLVAMGHNGRIAWSFTVAPVDVFETYRFERHPEQPDRVRGPDGWEPLIERSETFRIRDQESVERVQYFTSLGRVAELTDEFALVVQWAGFELPIGQLMENGFAIKRATDFDHFRAAASDMGAMSVNWSYSDREGNIGYVQSSPVPVRQHEQFFGVLDADNPDHIWDGFHPPDTRPWALNPERGWLANANNAAVGDNWDYPVPGYYKQLRIRRISDLLNSGTRFSRDDMSAFQLDRVSDRALSWSPWLAELARASNRSRLADDIEAWDDNMRADSDIAGLFARWFNYLGPAIARQDESIPPGDMQMLIDEWLHTGDQSPLAHIDREQAGLDALEMALKAGIRPLGGVQQLHVRHAMADNPVLDRWLRLSRGPFPIGGDPGTLNVSYAVFDADQATLRSRAGPSMRYVLDWSDPDSFRLNLTTGQSGHPSSPHFDDFLEDFLSGQPWIVPWSREAVEQRNHRVLRLTRE
ncbi:penicillin acylase family protein [Wenzhouxiangella sp. AB-CW3]|uniref:penicillin acylase family protein n=1 Tax=Wenzhouxiangella sp. AB-CW3 TaxID=2771012 RepID=UPI00168B9726|nr:penicillin acylase family protein [Wenzhouxiangella sp. AB-CW3]QOC21412.1 penicillin acylase family protein [Wenzhouxiangella sp. AB-CW3]